MHQICLSNRKEYIRVERSLFTNSIIMEDKKDLSPSIEEKTMSKEKWCRHGYCGWGGRFAVLRLILGILILGIVFTVGVKVGEFKSSYLSGYSHGHKSGYEFPQHQRMMRSYWNNQNNYGWGPMMQQAPSPSQPATPTVPPAKLQQ